MSNILQGSFLYIARLCRRQGSGKKLTKRKEFYNLNERRVSVRLQLPKTHHTLERLNASGEDSESIENGIETLWKVLDACQTVMEQMQVVYLRLGDNKNN